jgi:clan AA aspartic protease
MVLTGYIDERNQPWVEITVGEGDNKKTLHVLVDTGFTGELQLPLAIAVPLGLKLVGVAPFEFADGSSSRKMLFSGVISFGKEQQPVTITVSNSNTPLLGTGLLSGYTLLIDYVEKQFTIKEAGEKE